MMKNFFLIIFLLFVLLGCGQSEKEISFIKESEQNLEIVTTYNEAYKSLDEGDPYFAAKKFLEAELLLPQSEWAPRSALMASYSFYLQNYYAEALSNLERFLKTYPNNKDEAYVHYLIAMCYYETIEDEKRDSAPLLKAKAKFTYLIDNYPNTDFALDAKFKIDLINDIVASKEIYIGRHYIKKEKWIAAINRFRNVVENYDTTIYVEEALHRLVEIYYRIGLTNESSKYAKLLGYNYGSGEWYKQSYTIFNKEYANIEKKQTVSKEKKGIIKRFKKLFE